MYQAIVETAVAAIIVIDELGLIQSFNPAAERIFGHTSAEVLGRNVTLLMSEEHARAHDSYLAAYRRTGVRKIIGIGREVVGRRRDGTIIPLDLAVAEWPDAKGKRFFTGMIHDITERKQAEAQLRSFIDQAPAPSPCSIGTCAIWPPAAAGSRTMGLTPTRCSAVRT